MIGIFYKNYIDFALDWFHGTH